MHACNCSCFLFMAMDLPIEYINKLCIIYNYYINWVLLMACPATIIYTGFA